MDRHGLAAWLESEGARGIAEDAEPSRELVELVAASRHLLVSPLTRAQATANAVLDQLPVGSRPRAASVIELSEAPLPVLQVPRLRLPLGAWGSVCRISWFLGYTGSVESRRAAVARAHRVARQLSQLAPSGPVTVIGHGIMNLLVARELRRLGWAGPRLPSHQHGGTSTFRRHDPTMLEPVEDEARPGHHASSAPESERPSPADNPNSPESPL
jgi:broad specificity phosphatase PhoE